MRFHTRLAATALFAALAGAPLVSATPALAQSQPAQAPVVEKAWSRAALAGRNGAAFFTIMPGATADTLTGTSSPVAAKTELHRTVRKGDVMEMLPVASVPVAPGKPVTFAPGGYHVMLIGLKQALKPGETFPLTLRFAHAGEQTVTVTVGTAGGMNMPGMPGMPGMSGSMHQ